jgi:hypothetical protein
MENLKIKSQMILIPPTLASLGNYAEVIEEWCDDYQELYGEVATVLITGKEFIPSPIIRSDFEPDVEEVEGEEPLAELTATQKHKLREACILQRNAAIKLNKSNLQKMFKGIWKRCSLDSKEKIKERSGTKFATAELNMDTVSLIN